MDPITVVWNGPLTAQQSIEQPDEALTCGEYARAFAEAHGIDGEVSFYLDGEDVPDDAPIDALAGETVTLRAETVDADDAKTDKPKPAKRARKAAKKRASKPKDGDAKGEKVEAKVDTTGLNQTAVSGAGSTVGLSGTLGTSTP